MDPLVCGCMDQAPPQLVEDSQLQALLQVRMDKAVWDAWRRGARWYLCGAGPCADLAFAESVLALRREGKQVGLGLVLPLRDYSLQWPLGLGTRFRRVFAGAHYMLFLPDSRGDYSQDLRQTQLTIQERAMQLVVVRGAEWVKLENNDREN